MTKERVVITGLGAITPLGIGIDKFWEGQMAGRSGVSLITRFDTTNYPVKIAGEVRDFDPADFMEKKEAKRMDRFAQYAVATAGMALKDAGLDLEKVSAERVGVIIGSGIGGIETFEEQVRTLHEKGPGRVSPFFIPMMISDMASGQVSIIYGAKGPNQNTVTACATGTHSIGDSFKIIQRGDADVMICGGTEAAVSPMAVAGFSAARALSQRNEAPQEASRPFDKERDGFVIGEGAGVLILESLKHALSRGARIYAEVVGYGSSGDAYHITDPAPGGEGAARAMAMALRDAQLQPSEVDYVNAHGTSTEKNDLFETLAIKRTFGEAARKLAVSSTKSMIGHLLGAAGGVEAVATTLAIYHGMIPPTINYHTPDPECDLDYVPNKPRQKQIEAALSNSFGFGGHNAVLAFRRYHE